jgi:hypothetical protein
MSLGGSKQAWCTAALSYRVANAAAVMRRSISAARFGTKQEKKGPRTSGSLRRVAKKDWCAWV